MKKKNVVDRNAEYLLKMIQSKLTNGEIEILSVNVERAGMRGNKGIVEINYSQKGGE